MNWYVYLIRCCDETLYTGITTDVQRRFSEHNAQDKKTAKYLRGRSPLKLMGFVNMESRSAAQALEHHIKKLPKQEKLNFFENQSLVKTPREL